MAAARNATGQGKGMLRWVKGSVTTVRKGEEGQGRGMKTPPRWGGGVRVQPCVGLSCRRRGA
ncbi:hypothetical protein GCM10008937_06640 [Deinococcus depolymerans]|uniref:Uncharacterized protein n=1 Tax=Deinococcus depolymerans TaxID=392408 RepID=A0ABN1BNA6_9DEIO